MPSLTVQGRKSMERGRGFKKINTQEQIFNFVDAIQTIFLKRQRFEDAGKWKLTRR